ncbi:Zinc finger BED domain-containing protein DAYSLEEPER, partial [Bienertia sinuspersici]
MQKMATKMHKKFDKYWTHFSIIMAVAVVLDPRFKYQFVEWAFKKVYGEAKGTQELVKFKERLEYLYGAYVSESSTPSPSSRCRRSSPTQLDGGHVDVASECFMMPIHQVVQVHRKVHLKVQQQPWATLVEQAAAKKHYWVYAAVVVAPCCNQRDKINCIESVI